MTGSTETIVKTDVNAPAHARRRRRRRNLGPATSVILCLYFALAIVAFWGPYVGLLPYAPVFTALYGVFLLIVAATVALRLLRRYEEHRRVR